MAVSGSDDPPARGPLHELADRSERAAGRLTNRSSAIHWRSLSDGLLVALLVCGPSLLAVEGLRHRVGRVWLVPAVIGIIGMLVAGGVAGRHRRRPAGALIQGVAVSAPVALLLVLADILYRLISNNPIVGSTAVTLAGSFGGAIVVACLGSLTGRALYLRKWRERLKL